MRRNRILKYFAGGLIGIAIAGCSQTENFGRRFSGEYQMGNTKYQIYVKDNQTIVDVKDGFGKEDKSIRRFVSLDLPSKFYYMQQTPLDFSRNTVSIREDGKTARGKEIVKDGRKEMKTLEEYAKNRKASSKPSSQVE